MRKASLETVLELARRDPRVYFIGSDIGAGTLDAFKAEMPDRFLMEGISEAHVIGLAAGLALEGKIVYVNTLATFLTRRALDQVVVDLCLHRARVRLIGSGGGLVYGTLGPTHEAIEDLGLLRPIPGIALVAPADAAEMRRLIPAIHEHPGPVYIRLGRGGERVVTNPRDPFVLGRPYLLRPGTDALLVTTGVMAQPALDAADLLAASGIAAGVLHVPTVKPLDVPALVGHLAPVRVVVTVEEHVPCGGLGSAVAEVLADANFPAPKRFRRFSLPDAFADDYGSQSVLWARAGLTAEAFAAAVRGLLGA